MLRLILKPIRQVFLLIGRLLELLAMGMLVAMVIIICYQVVLRFVFNQSPSWSEEIAIVLMIWFGILSIPIGVKHNLHIGIEFLYSKCPPPVQYVVSRAIYLLLAGFGVFMIVYGLELTQFMTMSTLPATKLPSAVEYVVIPIAGVMLIYNAAELMLQSWSDFQAERRMKELEE